MQQIYYASSDERRGSAPKRQNEEALAPELIEAKGYPIELGIVQRTGACGPIDSIYLLDADENLVEISVYKK